MIESIEIPPPRPKRKPMHPYPRKLVLGSGKESPMEHPVRSTSPHSSLSEQDNRSPTSVLSGVISDTPGSVDTATPNGSPPPISSSNVDNEAENFSSEDNLPHDDGHLSQSDPIHPVLVKLELFPNICAYDKEDCGPRKVLKLFGKNVFIPNTPMNSSTCVSKTPFSDMSEGILETSAENTKPMDIEMGKFETSDNQFGGGNNPMEDGNAIQVEKPIPLPWWVLFRGMPIPPFGCHSGDAQEKETQFEESCAASNSGSVNGEANADKTWDAETQSGHCSNKSFDKPNASSLKRKSSSNKIMKGFVPYKRCFSERDLQSSTITSDDREGQRVRLCL